MKGSNLFPCKHLCSQTERDSTARNPPPTAVARCIKPDMYVLFNYKAARTSVFINLYHYKTIRTLVSLISTHPLSTDRRRNILKWTFAHLCLFHHLSDLSKRRTQQISKAIPPVVCRFSANIRTAAITWDHHTRLRLFISPLPPIHHIELSTMLCRTISQSSLLNVRRTIND